MKEELVDWFSNAVVIILTVIAFIVGLPVAIWTFFTLLNGLFDPPRYEVDKVEYQIAFKECLKALPAGPEQTHYNDWNEVVRECRYYAEEAATRRVER